MLHAGRTAAGRSRIDRSVWGPGDADRDMLRQLVRRLRGRIKEVGGGMGDRAGHRASYRDNPRRGLRPDAG